MSDTVSVRRRSRPLLDPPIVRRAVGDAFRKLNPRLLAKNPVMFVVAIGAALTTILLARDLANHATGRLTLFEGQVTAWLWFTVLFATFAEAMAEGRGKAQADTLRKTRKEMVARRERPDDTYELGPSTE